MRLHYTLPYLIHKPFGLRVLRHLLICYQWAHLVSTLNLIQ